MLQSPPWLGPWKLKAIGIDDGWHDGIQECRWKWSKFDSTFSNWAGVFSMTCICTGIWMDASNKQSSWRPAHLKVNGWKFEVIISTSFSSTVHKVSIFKVAWFLEVSHQFLMFLRHLIQAKKILTSCSQRKEAVSVWPVKVHASAARMLAMRPRTISRWGSYMKKWWEVNREKFGDFATCTIRIAVWSSQTHDVRGVMAQLTRTRTQKAKKPRIFFYHDCPNDRFAA